VPPASLRQWSAPSIRTPAGNQLYRGSRCRSERV
jgi:hypothetical protein